MHIFIVFACVNHLSFSLSSFSLALAFSFLPPDVPSYVYMNKRLKTDAAGIPHRSLDSYQHSSARSQSFKAPYNSFKSYESSPLPTPTPPKPPRSYSSSVNHPRGSPTTSTPHQSRERDFPQTQSLNSNIPRSNSHYNGSTGSHYGNETESSFSIRLSVGISQEPHRSPPPPPSRPPLGSHDQEVDMPESKRPRPAGTGVSCWENQCLVLSYKSY